MELKGFRTEQRLSFGHPQLPPNRLVCADNMALLRSLGDGCVDLIYVDPPFFTGQKLRRKLKKDVDGPSFSDFWSGDVALYVRWLSERLAQMRRVLSERGSIFVHLDWHAAHYVKVEIDKIFGYRNFQNEIIWCHAGGGTSKVRFGRKHDNILWYSRTDSFCFNPDTVRVPYQTAKIGPQTYHPERNKKSLSKVYVYRPNPKGKISTDVWADLKALYGPSSELTGYPTQKPIALLGRIIGAASNKGDLVADFFCGSGSALIAASRLERRWLGCDASREAVDICARRLREEGNSHKEIQLTLFAAETPGVKWPDVLVQSAED